MAIQTDWGRRDALCDWLTANGINPADVPIDGDLTIVDTNDGRAIRVEVELRSEDGRVLLDEREHQAAREVRTVPLLVEPPDWWEPYEKPTRPVLLAAVERVRKTVAALHADAASARLMGHETSALAIEGSARRISRALDQTDAPGRIAP